MGRVNLQLVGGRNHTAQRWLHLRPSDYVWQLQAMDDASHRLHTFSHLSRVTIHDALIMICFAGPSSKFASYSDDCMLLWG